MSGHLNAYEYSFIKRQHALFTSVVTLSAAFLFLLPDFPFPAGFLGVCIASSVFHLFLFLMFDRATPFLFTLANVVNLAMLTLAVHYTGGVMSPFTMVFALVLISGAGYGVNMPVALGVSIGLYVGVIVAEKNGVLPVAGLSPVDIYASWPATLFVLVSVVAFMVSSGSIYRLTINTLRRKVAQELELRQVLADRLARLDAPSQVGLLVQRLVHDVNTPLNAVSGLIQLLKEDAALSEQSREDCRIVLQELGRVNNLLGRMLRYVKPGESGRDRLCPRDVIESVLPVVAFLPGAAGISVSADLPPPGSFTVHANKDELQQVLFNIIKNAIEAIPASAPQRWIRVRLARQDDAAVISIADSGTGVPRAVMDTLGREMLSTKPQGSGIGLIIAREIILACRGTLSFESLEGAGTTVTVSLPVHGTEAPTEKRGRHEKSKTV